MADFNDDPNLDVLQNIEFAIVHACKGAHAGNTDYEVMRALDALLNDYRALTRGREPRPHMLDAGERAVYDAVKAMCDWRTGKSSPPDSADDADDENVDDAEALPLVPSPLSNEDMFACLKKIRKSVDRWNSVGGNRGYLNFVAPFVP